MRFGALLGYRWTWVCVSEGHGWGVRAGQAGEGGTGMQWPWRCLQGRCDDVGVLLELDSDTPGLGWQEGLGWSEGHR